MSNRLPNSQDSERAVLAAMHFLPATAPSILDTLTREDFFSPLRGDVFDAIATVQRRGHGVDTVLVVDELKARHGADHGPRWDELESCLAEWTSASRVEAQCLQLLKMSNARRVIDACMRIASEGFGGIEDIDDFLDRAEAVFGAAVLRRNSDVKIEHISDVMMRVVTGLQERQAAVGNDRLVGVSTGLVDLDRSLGGLKPGSLYVIAGRPGMGKSALAQQFAHACGKSGKRVEFFSLEMPADELGERMLSAATGINGRSFASGEHYGNRWDLIQTGAAELSRYPIEFPKSLTFTVETIRRVARRSHTKHRGLGCVVVDYLQLVSSAEKGSNREQEVAAISRGLKLLAMELHVPVVAVAQLNRQAEARADKRPLLSDLRESGAIEQDADAVLLLYRDEYYNQNSEKKNVCEIIVAKQRGGPTGTVAALFIKESTSFSNLVRAA